ncbi:MAG: TonB-dependent receptor [Bacteroides sp.]|jgi:TonB-linked SusC/RagA family outer membrane protein|nr:TonB-dependent receptor [Bacteroides sp.]
MKKTLWSFLFLMVGIMSAIPLQGQTLKGVVKDSQTGETLPGANILIKGTTQGTVTNFEGEYSLSLSPGTFVITYSFISYVTQEIELTIGPDQTITRDIELSPDVLTFEEFVVIGYGAQKKKVVTGAISSVSAEEINSTPILRVEQAMQGRTAGVMVTNLSGQPGEAPTVRVRGAGTTGNPEPLYIVDGLKVDGIDYLNPGDIESIDVLKDAASAAIYGARAANGVILITTKSGTRGKMNITFSTYTGIQNAARTIDMLNAEQYMMLMNEGARNSGQTEPYDLNEIPQHNTNWQNELFQTNVPISNHEIAVSGGSDKSTFASSLSYFSQQGIIGGDKSQFDRITARLNTQHQVTDFIRFGNNLAYSHIIRRGIASNTSFNGPYSSALNLDPLTPVYETDENILALPPYSNNPVVTDSEGRYYGISEIFPGGEIVNPLALIETQTGQTRVDKVVGNIFGELEPIPGLVAKTSLGIDLAYVLSDSYRPLFYLNGAQNNTDVTSVSKTIDRYYTWQWENTLSYTRQFGLHNVSALIGTTASKENFENLFGYNTNVPIFDPDHVYIHMATDENWRADGRASHAGLLSQFGRILYDYKSIYAFNATIRRDGSSRFGANNRYGIFPSLGFSWVVSEENFFPELGAIDILKLRASWGVNGNERIGNYQFVSLMDMSRGYIFGSGREFGASPQFIENNDIRWEESEQIDIALDFGAFNNRLTATIDYYVKTTKGLLERIPIPAHVGNDPPFANVGSVQNKGVELSLNWRNYTRDFRYSIGLNGAYNQNKMTKIGNEEGVLPGASWAVAGMITRTELGLPIAYFYGYKTDGIFQNQAEVFQHINQTGQVLQPNAKPGDVRFVDVNGDGVINADDRTMIGNPTPKVTLGSNANFEYRQFDLGFLIVGAFGHQIFNGMQRQDLPYTNRTTAILDRWTGEGTSNTIPRYTWNDTNFNYRVSDLYIEDGSYVRLKNIQLGYTFPHKILQRIKASTLRVYVSAENLVTLTRYTGADPEIGALSSFDIGIDRGVYPQARTFRLGTTISF